MLNNSNSFKVTAKTFFGFEDVVVDELQKLGATNIEKLNRAVQFDSDLKLLYTANLALRTVLKILVPIRKFRVNNEDDLYRKIKTINWSTIFNLEQTFAIDSSVHSDFFRHSQYVALKCKDAIVDQFRDKFDERPNIETETPDIRINIHISDKQCTVSLDSSGANLNQRGYRKEAFTAPLNEVLAAGLLKLSGWDTNTPLLDPMCGSGTIAIEAALMARNIAPNFNRKQFAFMNWGNFNSILLDEVKTELKTQEIDNDVKIMATDNSAQAITQAIKNSNAAGVANCIEINQVKFQDLEQPFTAGVIIMNPPYQERLNEENGINELYTEIGTTLKHSFNGYSAWIISSNIEAMKNVGLRPSRKIKLFNGGLECSFRKYELYKGSKKASKQ